MLADFYLRSRYYLERREKREWESDNGHLWFEKGNKSGYFKICNVFMNKTDVSMQNDIVSYDIN